jgi:hypothetical protein
MKLIKSVDEIESGKQYVCGRLHPDDKSWELWSVLDWDDESQVFYCTSDLFDEGVTFDKFQFVYELPILKR